MEPMNDARPVLPSSAQLFEPLKLRDVELKNRIVVSPMCQYSSKDGFANDWHFVHHGSRAVGGAGLIIFEASGVEARGRITDWDLGIYKDEHIEYLARIVGFLHEHGAVAGIQLAHAGRKASTRRPWEGGAHLKPGDEHGWQTVSASDIPFNAGDTPPHALTREEIRDVVEKFAAAARRALKAGFKVIELHGAHGYLIHQFLSPLANRRTDEYGGAFENRVRFALEVTEAVRREWPQELPLFFRVSATDWHPEGWSADECVRLAAVLHERGVDLIDCSSGGLVPGVPYPVGSGYQVAFAERIRREARVRTGAVGMINTPDQADTIVRTGQADLIIMARALLRDPYWALHAAPELHVKSDVPPQYERAYPPKR
jgi:2,4-dienoyl-CoA reductase-like NADH-dependent reductase (Old Yellow Enzyme family)